MTDLQTGLYRKRPVVIEATQWIGGAETATPIIDWILRGGSTARYAEAQPALYDEDGIALVRAAQPECIAIDTLEGVMTASAYDWIIRGVQKEFYPCKPDIFDRSYEPDV